MTAQRVRDDLAAAELAWSRFRDELPFTWASIRAASAYVQQLDQLIVKADVWGNSYANAQAVLDGATGRLEVWSDPPPPRMADTLHVVRVTLYRSFRQARKAITRFDWQEAQACLYQAGCLVYDISPLVEVEL